MSLLDLFIGYIIKEMELSAFTKLSSIPSPSPVLSARHSWLDRMLLTLPQQGVDLAVRDVRSSDPYVIFKMGKQKLKTHVVWRNINPEWNEELTMSISDPNEPIKLHVYDKDMFSLDDKMGDAEFEIGTFLEAMRRSLDDLPSGTIITRIQPSRKNCLAEESTIVWEGGKVFQNLFLRLRNVESGEIQLRLHWVDIHGSKGL